MNEDTQVILGLSALVLGVFAVCIGMWVWGSSMEARAYERITGVHVSTLDAMFVELRVQEGAKE